MAETPGGVPTDDDAAPPRAPRWVKISAAVALVLAVLVVIVMVAGGNHGPGRHTGGSDAEQHTAPPESGHMPPAGVHSP